MVGRCRWRILTSGACDEACILFGCRMSLYALSESVCMLVQFKTFSARASARMRAMHSVWNTEVALTLSSCAKCMLMIDRCFHSDESSVITSPAVAVGLSRSGDSMIICSWLLFCVYDPSVKILILLRPLSLTRLPIIVTIDSSVVEGSLVVGVRCSLEEMYCRDNFGWFFPFPCMSPVMVAMRTLSVVKSSEIFLVTFDPPPVESVLGEMVSVSLYASGLFSFDSPILMYASSLFVDVKPRISVSVRGLVSSCRVSVGSIVPI